MFESYSYTMSSLGCNSSDPTIITISLFYGYNLSESANACTIHFFLLKYFQVLNAIVDSCLAGSFLVEACEERRYKKLPSKTVYYFVVCLHGNESFSSRRTTKSFTLNSFNIISVTTSTTAIVLVANNR